MSGARRPAGGLPEMRLWLRPTCVWGVGGYTHTFLSGVEVGGRGTPFRTQSKPTVGKGGGMVVWKEEWWEATPGQARPGHDRAMGSRVGSERPGQCTHVMEGGREGRRVWR